MPVRNLKKIFRPKSVTVIGASRKATSVGHMEIKNVIDAGFKGAIYPVNPKYKNISEAQCFASVGDLPEPPDLAVICTPAATVPEIVRECGEAGIRGLVVLSAGFRESGSAGEALEAAIQ